MLKLRREAVRTKNIPVLRPLVAQARGRHDNHWSLVLTVDQDRRCDGECNKCLTHANLVRQNYARLSCETREQLTSCTRLTIGVAIRDTFIPETDFSFGERREAHRKASSKAAST